MNIITIINELITNSLLINCFFTYLLIQTLKIITYSYKEKKIRLVTFFETGGMPSSHVGLVTALTVSVFLVDGISSLFVVTALFAAIVIRDSYGVRKSVGDHSMTINEMIQLINKKLAKNKKKALTVVEVIRGHTLLQVIVGMFIGIIVPIIFHYWF